MVGDFFEHTNRKIPKELWEIFSSMNVPSLQLLFGELTDVGVYEAVFNNTKISSLKISFRNPPQNLIVKNHLKHLELVGIRNELLNGLEICEDCVYFIFERFFFFYKATLKVFSW